MKTFWHVTYGVNQYIDDLPKWNVRVSLDFFKYSFVFVRQIKSSFICF